MNLYPSAGARTVARILSCFTLFFWPLELLGSTRLERATRTFRDGGDERVFRPGGRRQDGNRMLVYTHQMARVTLLLAKLSWAWHATGTDRSQPRFTPVRLMNDLIIFLLVYASPRPISLLTARSNPMAHYSPSQRDTASRLRQTPLVSENSPPRETATACPAPHTDCRHSRELRQANRAQATVRVPGWESWRLRR